MFLKNRINSQNDDIMRMSKSYDVIDYNNESDLFN